jgi:hypothetical protein
LTPEPEPLPNLFVGLSPCECEGSHHRPDSGKDQRGSEKQELHLITDGQIVERAAIPRRASSPTLRARRAFAAARRREERQLA